LAGTEDLRTSMHVRRALPDVKGFPGQRFHGGVSGSREQAIRSNLVSARVATVARCPRAPGSRAPRQPGGQGTPRGPAQMDLVSFWPLSADSFLIRQGELSAPRPSQESW